MIKKCEICNIEIETANPNKKYCSPRCGKQGAKIRAAKRRGNDIIKYCPICGERFEIGKNGALTKYCSRDCADEARRIRNREKWRKDNPGWDDGTNKVCEWCGKSYKVRPRNAIQSKFCSDECAQTCYSREVRGCVSISEREREWEKLREQSRRTMVDDWSIQDWKYIGGYTKGNSDIQMKCLHCNIIITVKIDDVVNRKTYDCTAECIGEVKRKQEQVRLIEKKERKKEEWKALSVKECTICGKEFKSWQPTQVTCSNKCSKKYNNKKKREYDRLRKYNVEIIDYDITLEDLYKRDNGTCHLCNKQCDWDDHKRKDGAFIVGPSYPSIDHVMPRSKGGVHSWNNVKLAHHYCNTVKNNNENIDDTKEEYIQFMERTS